MKKLACVFHVALIATVGLGQDIVITDATGPKVFDRFTDFEMSITLKNQGIVDINTPFYNKVLLSTDNVVDDLDQVLGNFEVMSLKAGETVTPDAIRWSPVIWGPGDNFYVFIITDIGSAVSETDETNNWMMVADYVVRPPNVEFVIQSLNLSNQTGLINDAVTPTFAIKNNGTTKLSTGIGIYTTFYLSQDNAYDISDTKLGYLFTPFDASGVASSDDSDQLIIPTNVSPGQYYLIGVTDRNYDEQSDYDETDETNNTAVTTITIAPSDIDINLVPVPASISPRAIFTEGADGTLLVTFEAENLGTTGVIGYTLSVYLSADKTLDASDYILSNAPQTDPSFHMSAGERITPRLIVRLPDRNSPAVWGDHYVIIQANADGKIVETNNANNIVVTDDLVNIPLPTLHFAVVDASLEGSYDELASEIKMNVSLANLGSVNYGATIVTIRDAANNPVYTTTEYDYLMGNSSVQEQWTLKLPKPLPAGHYTMGFLAPGTPTEYTLSFEITPVQYALGGTVMGEDGIPITKGKLFLYQKNGTEVKFYQVKSLNGDNAFSFQLDSRPFTLYFIPDKIDFSQYIPTILGKTVRLNDQSFLTLSENQTVMLEILKLKTLGAGSRTISGTVSQKAGSTGRTEPVSIEGLPVLLLSESGEPVALTQTDGSGYYEFKNLPQAKYSVLVMLELDVPQKASPIAADVSIRNAQVDLIITPEGTESEVTPVLLTQQINFGAIASRKYTDGSFAPVAHSTSDLPVVFTSSKPDVAKIENGNVIILNVGTTVITASQAGDDVYNAADEVTQTLTITKGDQTITFNAIASRKYTDGPFAAVAHSTSDLPVIFASSNPDVAKIENGNVIIMHAGTTVITASQAGDDVYDAADEVTQTLTIAKGDQTITFSEIGVIEKQEDITLDGVSSSTLPVTYTSSNSAVATIAGNVLKIHDTGQADITAHQTGDDDYEAAPTVTRTVTVQLITGIEDPLQHIAVYPNPTTGLLVLTDDPSIAHVTLTDVTGRTSTLAFADHVLDLRSLNAGVYLLHVQTDTQTKIFKVIKQ